MKMTGKGFSIPPEMIGFTLDEKGKIQSEKEGVFRQYLLAEGVISVCIKENAETADYFKVRKVEWEIIKIFKSCNPKDFQNRVAVQRKI